MYIITQVLKVYLHIILQKTAAVPYTKIIEIHEL